MLMEGAMFEDGGRVEIDGDQCKGCGMCVAACPTGSLRQSDSLNRFGCYPTEFVPDTGCTACSVCFYACPEPAAISVNLAGEKVA